MAHEEPPTYSTKIDAVAFHPGNFRDSNTRYDHTISIYSDELATPLDIDIDADGRIIMIEVMEASKVFPEAILAAFKQIDQA